MTYAFLKNAPDAPVYTYVDGACGHIILNRVHCRNALNSEIWRALPQIVQDLNLASDVRFIVLHGGVSGAFAAGADISEFGAVFADRAAAAKYNGLISTALDSLEYSPKPTIAAIEGPCVGGGVSLAAACDFRFACASARLGVTPAKLGLVYPHADTRRLIELVGLARTKDILFTGRLFSANDALEYGLIDQLVSDGDLLESAISYGMTMANNSQSSIRKIREMIAICTDPEHQSQGEELFFTALESADFKEGRTAFMEKRKPRFPEE